MRMVIKRTAASAVDVAGAWRMRDEVVTQRAKAPASVRSNALGQMNESRLSTASTSSSPRMGLLTTAAAPSW